MKFLSRLAVPLIVLAVLGLTVGLAISLKDSQNQDVSKKIGLEQKLGSQLPLDTNFKDEHGNVVKLGQYFGRQPVLMMLVFYSCQGSCEIQTQNAVQAFNEMRTQSMGRDYQVVSLSIHPKETPELALLKKSDVLSHYNRAGGYDGWHFLTGDYESIRRVSNAIGYRYSYEESKNRILHPTGLFVVTPQGKMSRYLYGVDYATPVISESLLTAGKGQINVPSQPILFGCLSYDDKTGKTRLNVMRTVQVAGISTVIILATSIFLMSRKSASYKYRSKEDSLD